MKTVFLPLDERPCNADFPVFLCENNPDLTLITPEDGVLGQKKKPADFEKVKTFLLTSCQDADALVLSVDMLLYGGIVPSRLHFLSKDVLCERLTVIRQIKAANPRIKIYAFSLVMRCPAYTSDDEEPNFYGVCGREIFLYGQNEHKHDLGLLSEEEYEKRKAELEPICGAYLPEFTHRRQVNIEMVLEALRLFADHTIDYFIIPQDDSAPYGYTAMDQIRVKEVLQQQHLHVDIYPGADEVGLTLLAHALMDVKGYQVKICPVYPDPACQNVIPLYEDRAVGLSIGFQIKNAGAILAKEEDADVLLYCNLPIGQMNECWEPEGKSYDKRDLASFINEIRDRVKAGKRVAIADIAYANGGDRKLGKEIGQNPGFLALAGYAGWNTSSNTLGTVICQSILHYFYGSTEAHKRFTALRVYEDLSFDSHCRAHLSETVLPPLGYSRQKADAVHGLCSQLTEDAIYEDMKTFCPELYSAYQIADCRLPWVRMFEVGLRMTERKGIV